MLFLSVQIVYYNVDYKIPQVLIKDGPHVDDLMEPGNMLQFELS